MVKLTVDDAMVERAWSAWINCEPDGLPGMRVALVAALEGKSLAGLERARKGEG